MYIFNAISMNLSETFFTDLEKTIIEFAWNYQRPDIAKAIVHKKTIYKQMNVLKHVAHIFHEILFSHRKRRR